MAGHNAAPPPLSIEAARVLERMRDGLILIGNLGDYGRDFRLMQRGAENWENVRYGTVEELSNAGHIRARAAAGNQMEYETL